MAIIKPITILRDTNSLSKELHEINEPIFITRNGYGDLVIMSHETYNNIVLNKGSDYKRNESFKINFEPKKQCISNYGYVRVASITPSLKVSDVNFNTNEIIKNIDEAYEKGAKVLVFPELSISSYTCGDLFFQKSLQDNVIEGLYKIVNHTKEKDLIVFVGAPLVKDGSLYNCAIGISNGEILGIVPKTYIPNYKEFYEKRYFLEAPKSLDLIRIKNKIYPFGTDIIFRNQSFVDLSIGVEICEDLWAPESPSIKHARNGATLIVNLSASNEVVSKHEYRKLLVTSQSGKLMSGYVYASSGIDESTTDLIYSGSRIIAINGSLLEDATLFTNGITYSDLDLTKLVNERLRNTTFTNRSDNYCYIPFDFELNELDLLVKPSQNPFLAPDFDKDIKRYESIIKMQAYGLKKRLEAISCDKCVVGLSGGLDSTLALLVINECFNICGFDKKNIHAITMPCFGTSKRTYQNALALSSELGITLKEISIKESVIQHFKDIGQDINTIDVTYENGQARERTQVLMDYSNKINGLLVGTGDLSELAQGWCTYNGDHMAMYGVNATIPKTLVKDLVKAYAFLHKECKVTLLDILNTPISPELKPLDENGEIAQKTENSIGPYELIDFYLYYFIRHCFSLKKIIYLAKQSYGDKYDEETLKKWLKSFVRRFYTSQFKRSCLPDGVKVGTVSLSPRGDFRMPSDASYKTIIEELDNI